MYTIHIEYVNCETAYSIDIMSDDNEVTARGMKEFFVNGQQEIQQTLKVADVTKDDVLPFNIIAKFLFQKLVEEMPELNVFEAFFLMPTA